MPLFHTPLKEGPGIPIVFLHGFLGTHEDWRPVVDPLPPSHCIGVDLPGHGQSPFTPQFDLPFPYFHLVGYSLGGRLALAYADRNPERIASLTLLSTHPGLKTETEKKKRLENDAFWAQKLLTLPMEEFLNQWYDQPLFKPFKPDFSRRLQQNSRSLAAALLHYSLSHQPLYDPANALILIGERDTKFRSLYENPVLIPNAGHMIHLENPLAAAEAIDGWIAKGLAASCAYQGKRSSQKWDLRLSSK